MLEIVLGTFFAGMFVELMIVKNGTQCETKLMRVKPTFYVFKKQRERILTYDI